MSRAKLHDWTTSRLIEQFVELALRQDDAIWDGKSSVFNRLYGNMLEVEGELKGRPGDHRRFLLPFLDHDNAQVRLKAAIALLAIAPQKSRSALQLIVDREVGPQRMDAGSMLRALDEGRYVPS